MAPALRDGDWIIVRTERRPPRAGELVVVRDPLDPSRLLAKRVRAIGPDGLRVASDAVAHADHFAERGPIPLDLFVGRPVLRYAPLRRFGIPR